jgi:hypothetical protein
LLQKHRRDVEASGFVRAFLTTGGAPPSSLPIADCGILGLLDAQTGTIENFWFEPGFDANLIRFIRANPLPYADLNCFEMSFRYAERFLTAGLPVVLCEGIHLGDVWRGDYRSTIESLTVCCVPFPCRTIAKENPAK